MQVIPSWVQWYEYTGVFGGSFWILLANVLIFWLIERFFYQNEIPRLKRFGSIGLLLLVPLAVSLFKYATYTEKGKSVEVVVVQPNYEPHHVKFDVSTSETMAQFTRLSKKMLTDTTKFLVFPETSFGGIDAVKPEENRTVKALKGFLDAYPNLDLIAGINGQRIYKTGEVLGDAVRVYVKHGTQDTTLMGKL